MDIVSLDRTRSCFLLFNIINLPFASITDETNLSVCITNFGVMWLNSIEPTSDILFYLNFKEK